jgi:aryl-alcohol dehydrogenase-like predicted oxidoreductase
MTPRPFGDTGLKVSPVGFGAGHIGGDDLSEDEAGALLNAALDLGVTLFDTARSYGRSEERIGRHLSHRRRDFVLSTKCGYGVAGVADWTGEAIRAGVDEALAKLRTDYLDIVHLHSCPRETLLRGDIQEALSRLIEAGKARVAAYSGEGEALEEAVDGGRFRAVQASVNLCDQRSLFGALSRAAARGFGVIAKRPLANAPWRFTERPTGHYCETYWERLKAMGIAPGPLSWDELALRFAAFAPGVSSCIAGTRSLSHIRRAAEICERGPLPEEALREIRRAFCKNDYGWVGQV